MATFNVEMRQRVSGSFSDIIYPKAHWANIDGKPSTFAPTVHTHDIDDINATGTPSISNFLRGDGAWATPDVGGGGGGLTYTSIKNWTGGVNVGTVGTWNALNLTEDISATGKYIIAWRYGSSSDPTSNPQILSMFIPGSNTWTIDFSFNYGGSGYFGAWVFSLRRHSSVNSRFEVSNAWYGEVYDNGSGYMPSGGTNLIWIADIYKVVE